MRGLLSKETSVRGIYSVESPNLPGPSDEHADNVAAREESRLHADLPIKLAISDARQALLPLTADDAADSALIVHKSALLDALIAHFEMLWSQAVPLNAAGSQTPARREPGSADQSRLIALLSAGMQDDVIARHLGVSNRTVGRRISELMHAVDARTRFQAGLVIGRDRPRLPKEVPGTEHDS